MLNIFQMSQTNHRPKRDVLGEPLFCVVEEINADGEPALVIVLDHYAVDLPPVKGQPFLYWFPKHGEKL